LDVEEFQKLLGREESPAEKDLADLDLLTLRPEIDLFSDAILQVRLCQPPALDGEPA
jgi:hypothetical protein